MHNPEYYKTSITFYFSFFFSFLFCFISCTRQDSSQIEYQVKVEKTNSQRSHVQYLNDVFLSDTLLLTIPDFVELNQVKSACLLFDQRLLISDFKSSQIFIFDSTGNYIASIGRKGQGPEEFFRPWYIAANHHHIVIGDFHNRTISIFDYQLNYLRSFQLPHMIHGLVLTEGDTLIVHDHETARLLKKESVYFYNLNGALICKLGGPFRLGYQLRNIPFRPQGPLLAKQGKFLFEMDYPEYQIKKYDILRCQSIEFASYAPKGWKSVSKFNYQKLKPAKIVDQSTLKLLDKFFDEFFKYSMVQWIAAVAPEHLVYKMQTGNFTKFVVFTASGEMLADNVFPTQASFVDSLDIFLPVNPNGFMLVKKKVDPFGYLEQMKVIVFTRLRGLK